ncbi:MAG: hypothetical protein FWG22_03115 [Prolixibacteraceae bacterium]|nr:hypothetical protein [Prolixibacteraceae bacterium]
MAVIIGMLMFAPRQIDWTQTFSRTDKRPFGNYVIYELLKKDFFDGTLKTNDLPLFNFMRENHELKGVNMIFITNNFSPNSMDSDSLFSFVGRGNNVLLASNNISSNVENKLNFSIYSSFPEFSNTQLASHFRHVNPQLDTIEISIKRIRMNGGFYKQNDSAMVVLSYENDEPCFVWVKYGEGNFFIHFNPLLFTNYSVLHEGAADHVMQAFSYLPRNTTYWDGYYKPNRQQIRGNPLKYIFQNQGIRQAYFTLLLIMLLWFLFKTKRRQRPIPVIEPLPNSSKEFAHTLGSLHYNKQDNKYIIELIFRHFLDYVRNKYYIETGNLDENFVQSLEKRSGVEARYIRKIIDKYKALSVIENPSREFLRELSDLVEYFYEKTGR